MERQPVRLDAFMEGDVYIDYPYERVKFRYEKETHTVYQRWYSETHETPIDHDSHLYNEAHSGGFMVSREDYYRDD